MDNSLKIGSGLFTNTAMVKALQIVAACEAVWPVHKSNCSGFVIAVARALKIEFFIGPVEERPADDLVDLLRGPGWNHFSNGIEAQSAANIGQLVLAGLTREELTPPRNSGHIVVVVQGPLHSNKYPSAYWGTLGGIGKRARSLSEAFNATDRDRVWYGGITIP